MQLAADIQQVIVLGTIALLFIVLFTERFKPAVSFLFAALILVITGILSPKDVLAGLANESIVSIVLLIIITAALRSNYDIYSVLDRFFSKTKTYRSFLLLMMGKVALLSSIVNNTPVVVLMTPYVFEWGKKNKISPSKLLIPLSYATIVGGMITIIGTSTTLVLNGFLINNGIDQISPWSLFIIGSAVALMCLLFLGIFSGKLLPSRRDLIERFEQEKREYLIEKRLQKNSELIGKTVRAGGLRNLKGVYLVEIVRGERIISPVNPEEVVEANDILIFAGNTDTIVDLSLSNIGIELPENVAPQGKNLEVVETVVSANSSIIGKSIKDSNFRERYDAAVVAIHRNGEKLSGKLGRIRLKAGDVLLLFTGDTFKNKVELYKDLYLISGGRKAFEAKNGNTIKLIVLVAATILLLITQIYNLFVSLLIICALMVALRMITLRNIKRDIDPNLIIILVLSLALGRAMIKTGAGELLASSIIDLLAPYGQVSLLFAVAIVTTILTAFITNVGAVSIAFPLTLALVTSTGMAGDPFYLTIAFAASAAFISPVGYQTNLIVYGPGGYNFKDFLKIGVPMTAIYLGTALSVILYLYRHLFF